MRRRLRGKQRAPRDTERCLRASSTQIKEAHPALAHPAVDGRRRVGKREGSGEVCCGECYNERARDPALEALVDERLDVVEQIESLPRGHHLCS